MCLIECVCVCVCGETTAYNHKCAELISRAVQPKSTERHLEPGMKVLCSIQTILKLHVQTFCLRFSHLLPTIFKIFFFFYVSLWRKLVYQD